MTTLIAIVIAVWLFKLIGTGIAAQISAAQDRRMREATERFMRKADREERAERRLFAMFAAEDMHAQH